MKALALAAAVAAGTFVTDMACADNVTYSILGFEELKGWKDDDQNAALKVFLDTCPDLKDSDWQSLCALATNQKNARTFFELFFRPVLIEDGQPALFTGYFEPELPSGRPWYSRTEIEETGVLDGRGLEIAWIDDPVDVFFLQIQGSGRIAFEDGTGLRVGYGGKNGHNYRSVGQELVRRGIYNVHQVSAQVIRNWVRRNPEDGEDLLRTNPAFVFFRVIEDMPDHKGPRGAMNRSITEMRSVAVDPDFVPLGAPVWIEKGGSQPLRRLMIAQDTGSAIKGAQRADIFFGTGNAAGRAAGRVRDPGRMVVLLPIQQAFALATETGE
jgi:membrane-bound lytic murein transglycosylase A